MTLKKMQQADNKEIFQSSLSSVTAAWVENECSHVSLLFSNSNRSGILLVNGFSTNNQTDICR